MTMNWNCVWPNLKQWTTIFIKESSSEKRQKLQWIRDYIIASFKLEDDTTLNLKGFSEKMAWAFKMEAEVCQNHRKSIEMMTTESLNIMVGDMSRLLE